MSKLRSLLGRFTGSAKPMVAEDEAAQFRDIRAVGVGALGDALVRAEFEVLGWPMQRNVILGAPGRSIEIDQLARAPGGVIVLGTKTYSGHSTGIWDQSVESPCLCAWLVRWRHNPRHDYMPSVSTAVV